MIRPDGEILASFSEPLHRIDFRDASATQAYDRPLQGVLCILTTRGIGDSPRA